MDELIPAIKSVLVNIAAFQSQLSSSEADIQSMIEEQGANHHPRFSEAMTTLADLMNFRIDADVKDVQSVANSLVKNYLEIEKLAAKTLNRIDSISELASGELIDDIRAKYSIPAISEFGLRVDEKSNGLLSNIETIHKQYQSVIKGVNVTLKAERPSTMADIGAYMEFNSRLKKAKYAIEMNNEKIEYAMRCLGQFGAIMQEGFNMPPETLPESDFISTIIRLGKFPMISEDQWLSWVGKCKQALFNLMSSYRSNVWLFEINFVSVDKLLDQYHLTMKTIQDCYYQFLKYEEKELSYQRLMEIKLIEKMRKENSFKQWKEKSNANFYQYTRRYREAYHNTLRAIRLLGDAEKEKVENEKNINGEIPAMEKTISDRIRVRRREEAYNQEKACFKENKFSNVDGEGFQKIKETFFSTGNSRQIIELLLKHAEGHVRKGGLIKSFLVTLEKTRNLKELVEVMEIASQFADLIECKTALGRRFRVMSTTGGLVNKLNVELKTLIKEETAHFERFNAVKMAIEDEKSAIFVESEKCRYEVIYNDFLEQVEKQLGNHTEIAALKEKFIEISLWSSNNESKVSRMALAVFQARNQLKSTSASALFNQFYLKHADVFKNLTHQQSEFPFTYRYQELKKQLAQVKTFRTATLKELWASLDHIASQEGPEIAKMQRMQATLNAYYLAIRESSNGSPGLLFSKGSRLANALREFMVAKNGFFMREDYVPMRVGFRLF